MVKLSRRTSSRLPLTLLAVPAAAGVPAGILWWLLAPGGLNLITRDPGLAAGTNPAVWLPRDLTLAAIMVVAGCVLGVFLADKKRANPQAALLLGLGGALAGSLLRLAGRHVVRHAVGSGSGRLRQRQHRLLAPGAAGAAAVAGGRGNIRLRAGTAGSAGKETWQWRRRGRSRPGPYSTVTVARKRPPAAAPVRPARKMNGSRKMVR
ncbi:hypothetical protein [Arthrobacter sp. SD76]|uniref:hypothetical protein n=1 Tax=Arthrobacter sp. SD76 TaxID=3415007 RepID=UPI003C76B190